MIHIPYPYSDPSHTGIKDHGSWIAIIIGHIYACCSDDDDEHDYDDYTVPMITATATNAVAAPMSARVSVPQFGK